MQEIEPGSPALRVDSLPAELPREACGKLGPPKTLIGLPRWCQWQRTRLPMQEVKETRVQSLGLEDLLEKELAPHSSILAWKIPWAEEPGGWGLQSMGPQSQTRLSEQGINEGFTGDRRVFTG